MTGTLTGGWPGGGAPRPGAVGRPDRRRLSWPRHGAVDDPGLGGAHAHGACELPDRRREARMSVRDPLPPCGTRAREAACEAGGAPRSPLRLLSASPVSSVGSPGSQIGSEDADPAPIVELALGDFFIGGDLTVPAGPVASFHATNVGREPHDVGIRGGKITTTLFTSRPTLDMGKLDPEPPAVLRRRRPRRPWNGRHAHRHRAARRLPDVRADQTDQNWACQSRWTRPLTTEASSSDPPRMPSPRRSPRAGVEVAPARSRSRRASRMLLPYRSSVHRPP